MNSNNQNGQGLIVYGHDYCPQSQFMVDALNKLEVDYEWCDVRRGPPQFQDELEQLASGYLSVPTLVFPDGTVMVEPWPGTVLKKLGLKKRGRLEWAIQRWFGGSSN